MAGKRLLICDDCGITRCTEFPPGKIKHHCRGSTQQSPPPANGPGTELKKILDSLGIQPIASCQCAAKQAEYNRNGVEWCKANREAILADLKTAYDEASLLTKLRAGAKAVALGMPLTIEGLLDLAIERAENGRDTGGSWRRGMSLGR